MNVKAAVFIIWLVSFVLMGCGEGSTQSEENVHPDSEYYAESEAETAEENSEVNEPEEIVIAVNDPEKLKSAAEAFETEYPQYQITILSPATSDDPSQFPNDIRSAVESGQGPDILDEYYVDAFAYAQAGYIQPWGELFDMSEQEDFLPDILDTGRIEGLLYGVPYWQSPNVLITDQSRMGNVENWDTEQMIRLVRDSGASRLASRLSGTGIIYYCALTDKTENPYIDWESGSCDFLREDFKELLRFAGEYRDPENIVLQETKCRRISKGEDFAETGLYCLGDMSLYDAVLEEETVYMGYPTSAGAKVIISTMNLFCNGASEKKDAAAAFIRFLLSEEQQNRIMEKMMEDELMDVSCSSIRIDTIEYCLKLQREKNEQPTNNFYEINQIYYYRNGITEKQEQQFREILFPQQQGYCYQDLYTQELSSYLWDALSDYMNGVLTEEEAAQQLQLCGESFFEQLKSLKLEE